MSRPFKIVNGFAIQLSFLVLPYYHRRETFYRHGQVSPIGFWLRLPLAYKAQSTAPPEWPVTQANADEIIGQFRKLMNKVTQSPLSTSRAKSERRDSRRCKFTQLMRIRPSDPQRRHFDDMRGTISVSRTGVYFQTSEAGYEVGMRLFLIMPYSQDPGSTNREYLAEVVRTDSLPNGLTGIGVKLLLETGPQHTYSVEPPRR